MSNLTRSYIELGFATILWGFGFIANMWALESFDSVTISVLRFGMAFLVGIFLFRFKIGGMTFSKNDFLLCAVPGLLLGVIYVLQSWGLEYTTATNSGFITTLYVVIVPFFDWLILRRVVPRIHYLWVFIVVVGTYLLIGKPMGTLNRGDLITLLSAFICSLQIVIVGRTAHKVASGFAYNMYQCFWGLIVSIFIWPLYGNFYVRDVNTKTIFAILFLAIGSTLIAFSIQARVQKYISASTSSVIFLLESPIAAGFAYFLLDEKLNGVQLVGALTILIGVTCSSVWEARR